MTPDAPVIEFRHVSFQLENGSLLLSDVSLAVHSGETLILLGRSGSGKTTALKLINRLLEPTAGSIHVDGRGTLEWDPIGFHIGAELFVEPPVVKDGFVSVPQVPGLGVQLTDDVRAKYSP